MLTDPARAWTSRAGRSGPQRDAGLERPVVLAVGRLAPQKDFATLLRGFAEAEATSSLHLVVLGEGPERGALVELASTLGIAGRMFLPGFVPNPQAYLRRARVFVLSSRNEGFPGALRDAIGSALMNMADGDDEGRLQGHLHHDIRIQRQIE